MGKRVILGTAGHIDHGKTALVKALTGVDTDRLKEEKQRGITIELGFTALSLPSGIRLGIVDVPGHEKFIDHMVAGATGIDLVLLVVAADEGVMPQTVEHLEICRLLGIRTGLVALTKADLVDAEMLELAGEEVRELVQGTFLEGKPILPFSAQTGEGKEGLLEALDRIAAEAEERNADGIARMPMDRVFSMKGFGTVVTGTLLSGRLTLGQTVEILPAGLRAKIRGIQVHNEPVTEAAAGSRTAVNLQGIEKRRIQRGEILAEPDRFEPSHRVYAHFQALKQAPRPLPNRFRVMVHWGTARVFGRVLFLDQRPSLEPGAATWVQIQMERPIFPVVGDRLIVRDFSTNHTLGGGVVLDPLAPRYKAKYRDDLVPRLERLRDEDPVEIVSYFLWKSGRQGCSIEVLSGRCRLGRREIREACLRLEERGEAVRYDGDPECWVTTEAFRAVSDEILEQLNAFHRNNPYQAGMPREAIHGRLAEATPERLVSSAVSRLADQGRIELVKDLMRLAGHRVRLSDEDQETGRRIEEILGEAGAMPPTVKDLAESLGREPERLRPLLDYLAGQGRLVKVSEELYYLPDVLQDLQDRLLRHLGEKGRIQASEFKTLSGTTRKYTIPLLEYFDRIRLTLRVGDERVLREKKA